MSAKAKLVFLGLDSASPALLNRWEEEGLLPTWRHLPRSSLRGQTEMPPGLGTGAMWASLFSGVSPAEHGRYFGRQFDPLTYKVTFFQPQELTQEPVWVAASLAGKRVAVIDAPVAPLGESLNGIQIKDWGMHDPFYPSVQNHPPELAAEVAL